jgi:hypothetical protein
MNRDMICTWLGLADKRWPPDPYALLGLVPSECDGSKVELRVQERMAKLRCYQLSHPEEATEAMNRLAQAFICLVERHGASARAAQPAAAGHARSPQTPVPAVRHPHDTVVQEKTRTDWQGAPPPVRAGKDMPLPCIPVGIPESAAPDRQTPAEPIAPLETEEQVIRSLAEESPEAHTGLVTLQAVIQRADQTRQLLIAWQNAGRYFGSPKRRLTRGTEKSDFTSNLETLLEAAEPYPTFVAHPGRPGYRAVALAYLGITPEVFNAMGDEPREHLARDWEMARKVLLAHRSFLLRQFKSLRRRGLLGRAVHALRSSFRNHPVVWTAFGATVGITAVVLLAILLVMPS